MNIQFAQPIKQICNSITPQRNVTFMGQNQHDSFSSEFKTRRDTVVKNLSHQKLIHKKELEDMKKCKNEEEFECALFSYIAKMTEKSEFKYINDNQDVLLDIINRKGSSKLSEEQHLHKKRIETYDNLVELYKAAAVPDTDMDVLIIKDILQDKYNVDEMYFNNDPQVAMNWLDTAIYVTSYGLDMPKVIVTCPYILASGTNAATSKGSTVIINPERRSSKLGLSTNHPLHAYVHETVHCNQPDLTAFNLIKIPDKFKSTADNISEYAKDNFMHEIHAELKTKQILSRLTPNEEKFLKYIEN